MPDLEHFAGLEMSIVHVFRLEKVHKNTHRHQIILSQFPCVGVWGAGYKMEIVRTQDTLNMTDLTHSFWGFLGHVVHLHYTAT